MWQNWSHLLIITVEAKFNSTVQLMKTLKRDITIKYGHRFFGSTKGAWTGCEQKHRNSGRQRVSHVSLDLQVSATGNKYKWNIPHLTGIFGGPCFVFSSQSTLFVLNKYNRTWLFLYKWNVMHIFPSIKLDEIVKETKREEKRATLLCFGIISALPHSFFQ